MHLSVQMSEEFRGVGTSEAGVTGSELPHMGSGDKSQSSKKQYFCNMRSGPAFCPLASLHPK